MDAVINPILYQVYNSILDNIRYRSGYSGIYKVGSVDNFKYSNGKRVYSALISPQDNCIHLSIKEDGETRRVFSGVIYTIEQFFLIDSLTQIH